ncbi:MAG: hypothetical protein NTV43_13780 [Methylococcales bacterium]|nr:hypothetical protein [Methylococcales bacterium]
MSEVVWLPEALQDAQRLHLFLLDKNRAAAARAPVRVRFYRTAQSCLLIFQKRESHD